MPLPHRAVAGALWLPGAGLGIIPPAVEDFYRSRLGLATAGNTDTPLVVYLYERVAELERGETGQSAMVPPVYWFSEWNRSLDRCRTTER